MGFGTGTEVSTATVLVQELCFVQRRNLVQELCLVQRRSLVQDLIFVQTGFAGK